MRYTQRSAKTDWQCRPAS